MQDAENKHWLDQLEVTGPIKGIMDFVDELSHNYDRRLAALHIEYQKDVEEILACYKAEKEEFQTQLREKEEIVSTLERELKALQQTYKTMSVEYKMTQDCLDTTKQELAELTKALKKEDELFALTQERIHVVNQQLRAELTARGVATEEPPEPIKSTLANPVVRPKKSRMSFFKRKLHGSAAIAAITTVDEPVVRPRKVRFRRTKEFFQQVVLDRITRPIILRPKQDPIVSEKFDDPEVF